MWMGLGEDRAQRRVERVHGTVALGVADEALAVDPDLDRRLGLDLAIGVLLDRHPPGLQCKQPLVVARLLAQQQLKRAVRRLELIAVVLERLHPLEHPRGRRRVERQARALGLVGHRALARQLGDQQVAAVADERRVDVLERGRIGADAGCVQPGLVREGVLADVRLAGVGLAVEQLVGEVRGLRQQAQLLVGDHAVAQLQLQIGDDRDEVRVAGALADAVHRALHLGRAGLDGHERVGDRAAAVVVAVDADRDARQRLAHIRHRTGDLAGQRGPVGVAQHDALGAGRGGRAQALDRVVAVLAQAVEEVLGVEDHALALPDEEGDGLRDHRQVLRARDAHDLLDMTDRGLADDRADGREAVGQHAQPAVLVRGDTAPARHAECGDRRVRERLVLQAGEQLGLLGVRRGEARLDDVDAEVVEAVHEAHLLLGGERHAAPAHAVAQRRVVELDAGHVRGDQPTLAAARAGTGSSHSR
jgi:hypothetical protein